MSASDLKQFESQLTRLEAIVNELENGELSLEESLARFEEGVSISRQCQQSLSEAEQRVATITSESTQDTQSEN